jgi:hypothetical protein
MTGYLVTALSVLTAVLLSATAGAEVYQWTDADGGVHYGDTPPQGQGQVITVKPAPPPDPGSADRDQLMHRILDARRQEREQKKQTQQQAAAEQHYRADRCTQAGIYLANMENANRIYSKDSGGERTYLNDAEREQEIAWARAEVAKWCE